MSGVVDDVAGIGGRADGLDLPGTAAGLAMTPASRAEVSRRESRPGEGQKSYGRPKVRSRGSNTRRIRYGIMASTDLATQLETLIDAVWAEEKNWDLMDRIDLSLGVLPIRRTGPIERPSELK